MPTSFIRSRGARVTSAVFSNGQTDAGIPDIVFPNIEDDLASASAVYAAFTMTSTSGTLTCSTEGVITPSGCTLREYYNIKPLAADAVFFAATARRKPGTTGSIAAQNVVISVNSVEVGRFAVAAASAGLDPGVGHIVFYNSAGDARVNLATYPFTIGVTAADADLEIVLWMVGNQD